MAKNKTTIRFWLRTDRPNKDGTSPVHLIYQIKGQRKYYSVPDIKIFPVNWDPVNQKAIYIDRKAANEAKKKNVLSPSFDIKTLPTGSEVTEINCKLKDVESDLNDIETKYRLVDKKAFSPDMVIESLKEFRQPETKKDEPEVNIVDFIKRFRSETTNHREGTLKEYKSLENHLTDYEKLKRVKFTFEGDASILNGFSVFLTEIKEVNNITRAKLISTFKTIIRHAKKQPYKYKINADYFEYSVKREDSDFEVIALSEDEFKAIYNLDLSGNIALDEARDIFSFSIASGLRYSDLAQLRREHIRKDNTIQMTSAKNRKKIEVPLNPISYSILQKYESRPYPLPVTSSKQRLISNQKLNRHIKNLGKIAGIDTPIPIVRSYGVKDKSWQEKKYNLLSIHVGRKTFISLSLDKGMALQEVMALSTHSSYKAVKRYIDVNKDMKKAVMAKAWGPIKDNKLKVV